MLSLKRIAVALLFFLLLEFTSSDESCLRSNQQLQLDGILSFSCSGDLQLADEQALHALSYMADNHTASAALTHVRSALALLMRADGHQAVRLHKEAKSLHSSLLPPLAGLHLSGQRCGGLSDIFYVSAVIIKQLVDSNESTDVLLNGLITLVTLTIDSGLHREAESHLVKALELKPSDAALRFRSVLMTPGVYESFDHLLETRKLLSTRLKALEVDALNGGLSLSKLDEFTLSPTFYFVYQVPHASSFPLLRSFVRSLITRQSQQPHFLNSHCVLSVVLLLSFFIAVVRVSMTDHSCRHSDASMSQHTPC